ncbi:MAG TPA: sugar transferase [Nocardioides sp.]|nr:sugar transferase [Nocardioides sp.]
MTLEADRVKKARTGRLWIRRAERLRAPSGAQPGSPLRVLARRAAVVDTVVLIISAALAWPARAIVPGVEPATESGLRVAFAVTPALILLTLAMLAWTRCYTTRSLGNSLEESVGIVKAVFFSCVTVAASSYFTGIELSRGFLVSFLCVAGGLLAVERQLLRRRLCRQRIARAGLCHRVVLVGSSSSVQQLSTLLARELRSGYQVVGYVVHDPEALLDVILPVRAGGSAAELRAFCVQWGADSVMVTDGAGLDLRHLSWDLETRNIELIVVPPLADVGRGRLDMRPVGGVPLVHVAGPRAAEALSWPKRLFDIIVASLAVLAVLPLMLLTAVLIKLYDGGPVLYRQRRVGLQGETFDCLKFRSMHVDAEEREAELRAAAGHDGALWKMEDDPRVTPIGVFIRRYSIDELPQLLNVLEGSMSLVGPRPQQQWEVDTYTDMARRRLHVRPGITGLWQVSGRSDLSWEDAMRLDLYYRDNWSLADDLLIILRTVRAVLGKHGAY